MPVNKIIFKLRIFGIVTFLLYFLSFMFGLSDGYRFGITKIRQILILVSFVIFAILILLQLYGVYLSTVVKEDEDKEDDSPLKS